MSKILIFIRRKSDGKVFRDVINHAIINVHNIYDDDGTRVQCKYDYDVGYEEPLGFNEESEFEKIDTGSMETADDVMITGEGFDRIKPIKKRQND